MGERAPFRAVRRPCFVSSLTPSRAMVSIRTMSVASHNQAKKVGAVIYLFISRPTGRSICLTFSPNSTKAGRICYSRRRARSHTASCSVSASPTSHSNFITRPSPQEVTGPVVHSTLHWPPADARLPVEPPVEIRLAAPQA